MRALIFGISGQDGSYMAQFLLAMGYEVFGTSRNAEGSNLTNLDTLGIKEKVTTKTVDPSSYLNVVNILEEIKPTEIYNLAGQTSVGLSFARPGEAVNSITLATLNILEAVRVLGSDARVYNSASGDCFGDLGTDLAIEETPFKPRSPYGIAKVAAHSLVQNYRDAYGIYASNGIIFNHESPLRPTNFVSKKIVSAARRISEGHNEKLRLGNLDISRDWGWAPDYVDAIWRILQQPSATDFIIATGRRTSLEQFVEKAFSFFKLRWDEHVVIDRSLFRPTDIHSVAGNPKKAKRLLGWEPTKYVDDVVLEMCKSELKQASSSSLL